MSKQQKQIFNSYLNKFLKNKHFFQKLPLDVSELSSSYTIRVCLSACSYPYLYGRLKEAKDNNEIFKVIKIFFLTKDSSKKQKYFLEKIEQELSVYSSEDIKNELFTQLKNKKSQHQK